MGIPRTNGMIHRAHEYRKRRSTAFDEVEEYKYNGSFTCKKDASLLGSLFGSRSISKSQKMSFGDGVGKWTRLVLIQIIFYDLTIT